MVFRIHRAGWQRVWTGLAVLAALAAASESWLQRDGIRLNEFEIQRQALRHGAASPREAWRTLAVSAAWRALAPVIERGRPAALDPARADSVFEYVFARIPRHANVYPGGRYYYFELDLPGARYTGSLCFRDAEAGRLHFHARDRDGWSPDVSRVYTEGNGLRLERAGPQTLRVGFAGWVRHFRLPPNSDTGRPPALLPEESVVARVRDESGLRFHLLFDRQANAFRYVLDDSAGVVDRLEPVAPRLFLGLRTGFAFHDDPGRDRRLLVGVRKADVLRNDWTDGPFDQVPSTTLLGPWLRRVYPGTPAGEGFDERGYLLVSAKKDRRVAITAYRHYAGIEALVAEVEACRLESPDPRRRRGCLTCQPDSIPARASHSCPGPHDATAGRSRPAQTTRGEM